jgi:selenocysteine lyase/cysteine desulfurase
VPNRDGKIEIEDITALITPRTRLLSISFVEFSNGFRNDLETIGKICKDHDIIFSVDGIQGIGAIPIDVQKYGIDFISNGGHKWMMGLMGSGFIYIQDALFKKLKPAFTGWLGVENAWDFFDYDLTFLPDARRYEYATSNFIGITSLAASTELLLEAGIENIEKHLLELGQLLIDGLSDAGMKFAGSENKKFWSGIYSFSGDKIEELFKHLQASNVICALRNGRIRLAPHFYNSQEEIKEIIDIIGKFYSI